MTITYHCDRCGYKLKPSDHQRIRQMIDGVMVEIISGWNRVWNGGNICHRCIKYAVKHGKPIMG